MDQDPEASDLNQNVQPETGTVSADGADVDVQSLTKVFESVRAVDSLSFRAYRGHVCFHFLVVF